MPTTLALQNSQAISLAANTPQIIGMPGRFVIQPGPGMSVTVEGSLNNVAIQAEKAGGTPAAGTWSDIAGGAVSGGAIKYVPTRVSAVRLTSTTAGMVYLLIED